jgi:hypothetical protein
MERRVSISLLEYVMIFSIQATAERKQPSLWDGRPLLDGLLGLGRSQRAMARII